MDILQLIIFILATWRISFLLVNEDGPWFIFERLRTRSGIYWHRVAKTYHIDPENDIRIVPDRFWPQLLSCIWCISPWIGAIWVIFFCLSPLIAVLIAAPFALSAGAILVNLVVEKLNN